MTSRLRNLDWFRKVPRCVRLRRACAPRRTRTHASDDTPASRTAFLPSRRHTAPDARSDLSEATLPGSIISLLAMFAMVILFFLVRARGCCVCLRARERRATFLCASAWRGAARVRAC
jgi:hypothetical protein